MKKLIWVVLCGTFMVSCLKQYPAVPSKYIQPEEFTEVMLNIRLAEAYGRVLSQKGKNNSGFIDSAYQQIYHDMGLTENQVEESFKYYVDNPQWMEKITADVIERLNRMDR